MALGAGAAASAGLLLSHPISSDPQATHSTAAANNFVRRSPGTISFRPYSRSFQAVPVEALRRIKAVLLRIVDACMELPHNPLDELIQLLGGPDQVRDLSPCSPASAGALGPGHTQVQGVRVPLQRNAASDVLPVGGGADGAQGRPGSAGRRQVGAIKGHRHQAFERFLLCRQRARALVLGKHGPNVPSMGSMCHRVQRYSYGQCAFRLHESRHPS